LLINKKCDLNQQNNLGKTPLHCAIENNKIDIAKILIGFGARTDLLDKEGFSVEDYSKQIGALIFDIK